VRRRRADARSENPNWGNIMFENSMATAVLPAADLDRAQRWWRDVFGREPVSGDAESGNLFYVIGGVTVLVYRTDFAGTAQNTAFNIMTDDLDRDAAALRERGVVFLDYDLPGLKTVDGIADLGGLRGAWFTDSEGNILAIGEPEAGMLDQAKKMLADSTS
jgi:catechol 2,3-dioxygenase-like lactoylglutathione lyase family enzyme